MTCTQNDRENGRSHVNWAWKKERDDRQHTPNDLMLTGFKAPKVRANVRERKCVCV